MDVQNPTRHINLQIRPDATQTPDLKGSYYSFCVVQSSTRQPASYNGAVAVWCILLVIQICSTKQVTSKAMLLIYGLGASIFDHEGVYFAAKRLYLTGLATIREQSASPVDKNAKNARRSSVQVMADAFKKLVSRADVKTQTDVSDMPQEGSDGGLVNSEKTSLLAFAWSVLRAISIALVVGMFFHLMFEGLNVGSRFVRSSVYIEDEGYLDDDEFAIE